MTEILVVDNHDSFVHILIDHLLVLGAAVTMVEADAIDADAAVHGADGVLISPGPGIPEHAGASVDVVRACHATGVPLLGVCLGHQAIAVAFGGEVGPAPELMHGMASAVEHDGTGVFCGMPQPFAAGRYHSLAVTRVPAPLRVTARTPSGVVMGLAHPDAPIEGVQFHPESVLTEHGTRLLRTWLERVAVTRRRDPSTTRA
ncbi:anthranilate synthase component II [Microbacterium luticocti]|uniref:anthranilate synthase component II n=1 Tax=Microbacterium luticocti TaxID=451764 RepID=UPI000428A7A3|nr:gamma-glutamyl-gamma-aminobutyrate hydrolase family protein [Microbacterium luticocti]